MNLNKLTKSYIKDIFNIIKKWHLSEIRIETVDGLELVFSKTDKFRIFVYDEEGEFEHLFIHDELKCLLDLFEKTEYYMNSIEVR